MAQGINSVAIVGAGISGVVAAKHLKASGLKVTVYERSGVIGGVWCYDERLPPEPKYPSVKPSKAEAHPEYESGPNGLSHNTVALHHAPPGYGDMANGFAKPSGTDTKSSPCYDGLFNNVSTPLLELKDHPWPKGTNDFVNHRKIKKYIQSVADSIDLAAYTCFHTKVLRIRKSSGKWHVLSGTLKPSRLGDPQYAESIREFDALVVASGHYHACNVPGIPGLEEWKARWPARVQHSKSYRRPVGFDNQNVLLIGTGASSMDIAREISPFAKRIYQVSRNSQFNLPATWLPKNSTRICNVRSFEVSANSSWESLVGDCGLGDEQPIPGTIVLEDGSVLGPIHRVIFCTGYRFSFPFFPHLHRDDLSVDNADNQCLVTDGTQAHNLHKDIFYIPDPTLAIVGVPFYSATFTLFEFQAIVVAAVYAGRVGLPREKDMRQEYAEKIRRKGHGRLFHSVRDGEVEYVDDLLAWVNKDIAINGGKPIEGHSVKWHAERAVLREKMAQWFLSGRARASLGD
ncbi:MAG: hypothetical protein Q9190_001868 [Brigantiaea leucoxantha]